MTPHILNHFSKHTSCSSAGMTALDATQNYTLGILLKIDCLFVCLFINATSILETTERIRVNLFSLSIQLKPVHYDISFANRTPCERICGRPIVLNLSLLKSWINFGVFLYCIVSVREISSIIMVPLAIGRQRRVNEPSWSLRNDIYSPKCRWEIKWRFWLVSFLAQIVV